MNLFAGAWEARDLSPLPVDIPLATDTQVSPSQMLLLEISAFLLNSLLWTESQLNQTFTTLPICTFTN